jgi:hypothetical protein
MRVKWLKRLGTSRGLCRSRLSLQTGTLPHLNRGHTDGNVSSMQWSLVKADVADTCKLHSALGIPQEAVSRACCSRYLCSS